jgi:HEPN domain-containing protein
MNKQDLVNYWVDTSDKDYLTMKHLLDNGDYHWALFMGHLVIEKLFKALFVAKSENISLAPKTHDLVLLAQKCELDLSEDKADILDLFTTFNINARYPDYKYEFFKLCTKKFTSERNRELEEIKLWLKELIKASM